MSSPNFLLTNVTMSFASELKSVSASYIPKGVGLDVSVNVATLRSYNNNIYNNSTVTN